ncbi:tryptophan--tRNA ligase [Candidatus Peregrinibacteria bacterium]|nr:tryptophan--tRNA ligase [Candidatus Peregrinibacteria bacterium]
MERKRILSGVQPSGKPHLGNYFGAFRQHIALQQEYETFIMIADLHALTTIRDAELMRSLTFELALTYLALGLDPEKTVLFKQSEVPEHAELCWIFDCITTMPFLQRAHAWKDAQTKGKKEITVGLFNYPILQACDILLYKPSLVPVGQDQKQHVEMCRDIAQNFNNIFKCKVFKIPDPYIPKEVAIVPGTDGQKMSKSYGNTIDIFADEADLKKQVMSIVTSSVPLQYPKDPNSCNVFNLYKLFANPEELKKMENNYIKGGFGYGDAKKALLAKILEYFKEAREKYLKLKNQKAFIYEVLSEGGKKAKKVASATLNEAKKKIGYI